MEPLISVIVPVYNVEKYLPKCLDSIMEQTYKNLQIILVDDGSKDNSGVICDEYAMKDDRIRVIHQSNAGIGAVRNMGIKCAAGEFVMFVDSDDWLDLDAVQVLYERIRSDGSDMAVGRHSDVYDDGIVDERYCRWIKDAVCTGQQVLQRMGETHRIAVVSWAKLYRKVLFEEIQYPELACGEDLWVLPSMIEKCKKISIVDKHVYYYYHRPSSIMRVYNAQSARDNLESNLHMAQYLWRRGILPGAVKWFRESIYRAYNVRNEREARSLLRQYMDCRSTVKLLLRQRPKTIMIWLAVYLPFIKDVVCWLKKIGIKK